MNDDELGFIASDELNPQKSRILLSLALLNQTQPAKMQELFRTTILSAARTMKALLLLFAIICLAEDNTSAQEKAAPPTNPPADNSQATLAQNSQDASQAEPTETLETTIDASEADEPTDAQSRSLE